MFTLALHRGPTRRDVLTIGTFGGAFTLADQLRASPGSQSPSKAAIHIVLAGGPPHLDMYDMKPDAPAEVRGEFKPIPTTVPGIQTCELMPKQARMWEKFAVLRSIVPRSGHDDAEISTGYNETVARNASRPSFGSVMSKVLGPSRPGVPPHISTRPKLWTGNPAFDFGNEPGFLGPGHRAFTPDGPDGRGRFCFWPVEVRSRRPVGWSRCNGVICTSGWTVFARTAWPGSPMANAPVDRRSFPPEVAIHLVKIACERPDQVGRSLSHWDCAELARQLVTDEVVETISPQTVQRILANHKLKPWRKHLWLSPQVPRDAEFCKRVKNICTLYTRKLAPHEMVLCVDEKTSLQPRTRKSPTLTAQPGLPVRVEREYERQGALNLFAAFDTRTVSAHTAERKRQKEFIEFLEQLERETPRVGRHQRRRLVPFTRYECEQLPHDLVRRHAVGLGVVIRDDAMPQHG